MHLECAHVIGGRHRSPRKREFPTASTRHCCTVFFPEPVLRRTLLKSVGAAALLGALGGLLPIDTLKAIAQ
jgi:hypothetical protein